MSAEGSIHLLIVEDETQATELLAEHLTRKGYRVTTASDGRTALERFVADPADLVITDLKMPGGDGLQLIQQIRARNPDVKIIVITGHTATRTRSKLERKGVALVMSKPISLREITIAVEQLTRGEGA